MTAVHRPGRPEDLPPAELFWARWAALAAVRADPGEERNGLWLERGELRLDTWGSSWGVLAWAGDGRAVLFGEDEGSMTKWHEPTIDVLAGAPAWLPFARLRDHVKCYELGFVYWYEDGAWNRAPYPDDLKDDGLALAMGDFAARSSAVAELEYWLGASVDAELSEPIRPACERFMDHAEHRTMTTDVVRGFVDELGWVDADVAVISAMAQGAGLMGG